MNMDYNREIKKLIDQIDDQEILRLLYRYVIAALEEYMKEY